MDLGWNSDFDAALLNCWNDNTETNSQVSNNEKKGDKLENVKLASNGSSPRDDGDDSWDGNLNPSDLARFPSFQMDYETAPSEKLKLSDSDHLSNSKPSTLDDGECDNGRLPQQPAHSLALSEGMHSGPPVPVSATASVTSTSKDSSSITGSSSMSSRQNQQQDLSSASAFPVPGNAGSNISSSATDRISNTNTPRLHPLAIQSSANCPPHGNNKNPMLPSISFNNSSGPPRQGVFPMSMSNDDSAANYAANLVSLHQQQLASSNQGTSSNHHHHHHHHQKFYLPVASAGTAADCQPPQQQQQQQQPASSTAKLSPPPSNAQRPSSQKPSQENPPPFYLFDAPIELRANFMQSQRKLGIPITHDCNSYHYGETVKGFHPQLALNNANSHTIPQNPTMRAAPVQLIDARHGNRPGSGRIKNEREQKRAQKITELIDQLRVNMENGGWKVEMRSKFHTLSS